MHRLNLESVALIYPDSSAQMISWAGTVLGVVLAGTRPTDPVRVTGLTLTITGYIRVRENNTMPAQEL